MRKLFVVSVLLLAVGCGLTREQRTTLLQAEARIQQYRPKVAAVMEKVRKGELFLDEGAVLITEYLENEAADKALIEKLREQDIPWYAVAGMIVAGAIGGLKWKHASTAQKILRAVVLGVEKGGNKETKASIEAAASRAGVEAELDKVVKANT